jgi:hypothetical protein
MKGISLALAITLITTPAVVSAAPAHSASSVTVVTVVMADRGFHPQVIRLRSGVNYRLRFVNRDNTIHDFFAPGLLNRARITREEGYKLRDGRLNVPAHGVASLALTPTFAAAYNAKSTKLLDIAANMKAQILVY